VHCRWSLVRGWITGLVMDVVPAAGGSAAQRIAYSWEIQRGKPGDQFGKGEVKAVAATEASNNGVTGTSLIPMFVPGVPGGIAATVILGALMFHGLQPGDTLFRKAPEVIYTVPEVIYTVMDVWVRAGERVARSTSRCGRRRGKRPPTGSTKGTTSTRRSRTTRPPTAPCCVSDRSLPARSRGRANTAGDGRFPPRRGLDGSGVPVA
jgi:hypothetical protein